MAIGASYLMPARVEPHNSLPGTGGISNCRDLQAKKWTWLTSTPSVLVSSRVPVTMAQGSCILMTLGTLCPPLVENGTIKLQQVSLHSFEGCTSFTYGGPVCDGVSPTIAMTGSAWGKYSAWLDPWNPSLGDEVTICAKLFDYDYDLHPGEQDLEVATVMLRGWIGTTRIDGLGTWKVLMDVPYYVNASSGLGGQGGHEMAMYSLSPDMPPLEICTVVPDPGCVFARWQGDAVDLGCVPDPTSPTLTVDLAHYFIELDSPKQCYLRAAYEDQAGNPIAYHVDAAGGGDFTSIQDAIDAASDGDAIEVAPGTYYETINFNGKAVHLYSREGAATTTIDGGGGGDNYVVVVQCRSDEGADTILEGFTITGGNGQYYGGGMFNFVNCSPTVANCIFTGNSAGTCGAGMNNSYNSNPKVTGCTFSNNSAKWGGGMFNFTNSSPTVTDCTFSGNSASNDGGGMYNWDYSNPTVTSCNFIGNSADTHGGGMNNNNDCNPTVTNSTFTGNTAGSDGAGLNNWRSSPIVTGCTFQGNSAGLYGGGMRNRQSNTTVTNCRFTSNAAQLGGGMSNKDSSCPTVSDCTFTDNSAIGSYGSGGGMRNDDYCSPIVTDCTFSGNVGSWAGGGMRNQYNSSPTVTNCAFTNNSTDIGGGGISNVHNSSPTLRQCVFSGNLAGQNGGGIDNYNSSNALVTNCMFSGNSASQNGGGLGNWQSSCLITNCTFSGNSASHDGGGVCTDSPCIIANCISWSNSGGEIVGLATVSYSDVEGGFAGEGNIDADPLFVNGSLALSMISPCIDVGDNDAVQAEVTIDLAGNPRLVDGNADEIDVVDMGAYEFQPDPGDAPTPSGENVSTNPADASGDTPVTITFSNVTESGYTHLETSSTPGHDAPPTFKFGTPPTYYDITTSATCAGDIIVCISVDPSTFEGPVSRLRLLHYDDGKWIDCTEIVDADNGIICGTVTSLSPFAVVESIVEIDIKPGSYPNSINLNGHGVIPVAVLGSDAIDVKDVDTSTLDFAGLAVRAKGNGILQCSYEDTNGDGYEDLVCQFVDDPDSWVASETEATLTGMLVDDTPFAATDEIRIVP